VDSRLEAQRLERRAEPVKNADLWQRLDEVSNAIRSSGTGCATMRPTKDEQADALARERGAVL
jgi:ribonuclease HI